MNHENCMGAASWDDHLSGPSARRRWPTLSSGNRKCLTACFSVYTLRSSKRCTRSRLSPLTLVTTADDIGKVVGFVLPEDGTRIAEQLMHSTGSTGWLRLPHYVSHISNLTYRGLVTPGLLSQINLRKWSRKDVVEEVRRQSTPQG